ncbi:MAG: flagellar basal body-associated FliL family protein [Sphingomonadales bacterium]|nr:flagellar basal body-associated FliL family protein [Sphingomonadales bacterium]
MSSDKPEKEAKPKKGGGIVMKAVMGLGLLGVGGGAAFGMMAAGVIGGGHQEKQDNKPKLIKKGEQDPYAPKAEGGKEGEGVPEVEGEGGSEYRTAYYSFTDEFTSNLKQSDSLVQVALACSTRRDGRVLMWIKKHELAIRSGMLEVLADTPEADITTVEGKERLQKRLTAAINKVLTQTEGFGGVDAVYFKSFIIQ